MQACRSQKNGKPGAIVVASRIGTAIRVRILTEWAAAASGQRCGGGTRQSRVQRLLNRIDVMECLLLTGEFRLRGTIQFRFAWLTPWRRDQAGQGRITDIFPRVPLDAPLPNTAARPPPR